MNYLTTLGLFSKFDFKKKYRGILIEIHQDFSFPEIKMSSLNIATLPRISRDALAALLQAGTTPAKLAIIDVRDSGMARFYVQNSFKTVY